MRLVSSCHQIAFPNRSRPLQSERSQQRLRREYRATCKRLICFKCLSTHERDTTHDYSCDVLHARAVHVHPQAPAKTSCRSAHTFRISVVIWRAEWRRSSLPRELETVFSIVLERPALICKGLPPAGRHSLETLDDSIPRHKRRGLRAPARRMIPCRTSNIASCLSQYLIQSCDKHILLLFCSPSG